MSSDLNAPSFFRKGGIPVGRVHCEVGRNPDDGTWYVDLKQDNGNQIRSIMTPDQAFKMFTGGLIAMARFQPTRIGEIRALLQTLAPFA